MNRLDDVKYRWGASFLLATLGRRAERAWNRYLATRDMTTAQFAALAALAEGERTQAQIALATGVDPRNMGATVRALIGGQWIQARPNPADARSRLLSLTPKGEQWWQALQPELRQERDDFFQGLSAQELATLESLLRTLEASHTNVNKGPRSAT